MKKNNSIFSGRHFREVIENNIYLGWSLPTIIFCQASIGIAPFETFYGQPCRSLAYWLESPNVVIVGLQLLQEGVEKVNFIRQKIKASQDR